MDQRNSSTKPDALNRNQRAAVEAASGPNLVIAGAGTGKTEVITKKISHLVESKQAEPKEILALTFTEKAAAEMLTRVDALSSYIYPDFLITTFHGFGDRFLRQHAVDIGLTSEYRVLSEPEQILFIQDNLFKLGLDYYMPKSDPTSFITDLSRAFSRAKDELISGDEYVKFANGLVKKVKSDDEKEEAAKILETANAYKAYCGLLLEAGYVDYGDLISLSYRVLKDHPSVLKKWQSKLKYFLIDEFQDTNYAQYELIKLLASTSSNLTVVADDDQAIYRFRGAASYNVMTFLKDFPKASVVTLIDNYRSGQAILDSAHQLIAHNDPERLEVKLKIDKKLKSTTGRGVSPALMLYESESAEADAIAEEIEKLTKGDYSFSQIAVLVRTNKQAEAFVKALIRHKIPHVFSGASGLYERPEIKTALAFFEAVADPDADLPLYHLVTGEVFNFDMSRAAKLLHGAKYKNTSLIELLAKDPAGKKIVEELEFYRRESLRQTAGQLLNTFLTRSGYLKRLVEAQDKGDASAANQIIALSAFFDRILDFQRSYRDHSLQKFVEFIRLMLKVGEDPRTFSLEEDLDAVRVLTVHKAKGLEFEVVFMASLADDHFPVRKHGGDVIPIPDGLIKEGVMPDDEHYREERRLFYVALTRAKEKLYLSAALDYGTKRTHKISRFVLETLPNIKINEAFIKTSPVEKLKHFEVTDEPTPILQVPKGDKLIVSRAKIDDYTTCPLKYKFLHVVPIKVLPDQAVGYGNIIHKVIEEYLVRRMDGRKVKVDELLALYDENWQNSGFLSPEHEKLRYEKGKETIGEFFKRQEARPLPIMVEDKFKFELDGAVIEGRFDVIEKIGQKTRIVDFKTSDTVKDREGADRRTKQSNQLKIYSYGYRKQYGQLPDEVSLYFVDRGIEGVYSPTAKDMDEIEQVMKDAVAGIRAANFNATPSLNTCGYCPFRFYCPYAMLEKRAA